MILDGPCKKEEDGENAVSVSGTYTDNSSDNDETMPDPDKSPTSVTIENPYYNTTVENTCVKTAKLERYISEKGDELEEEFSV